MYFLKFLGCLLFILTLNLLLLLLPTLLIRVCIAGVSGKMMFKNKKSSLLCKIFPLELLPCSTFRTYSRERDQKMDEKRETKEPSSYNLSSSAHQISPTEKRTPIEVFQVPGSSGVGHSKGESDPTHEQDEAKTSLSSFRPVASTEASRKWMAFESESFDITKTYTKNFSGSFRSYSTKLLETNMTKRTAEENKIDGLSLLQLTRFLQGPETDKNEVAKIRDAIRKGSSYCGKLLNYKKNGTPFWNLLTVGPVKDSHGNIIKFIGMQVEIPKNTEGMKKSSYSNKTVLDEKEKTMRSTSIIEVQAEREIRSIVEVQAVKSLRSHIQSKRHDADTKNEEPETTDVDYALYKALDDENISTADNQKAWFKERTLGSAVECEEETVVETSVFKPRNGDHVAKRERDTRQGIELATTLERIEKIFFITNPRLPDNPIIFASRRFLDSTEYTSEEVLGRNLWFLQGPETDPTTVSKINNAIEEQREITLQIINYTKSGKKFLNLFHLQPMCDQKKGELQYFIGVQLHQKPSRDRLLDRTEHESAKLAKAVAENVDKAVRELPDANLKPKNFWEIYCQPVLPRPHKKCTLSWIAIQKVTSQGEKIGLHHFRPIKPLGFGDIGSVHLVELKGTGELFAMKAIEKSAILNRNKVHRACMEREIISLLDHPFMPTLYSSFQSRTHIFLIMDFCPGGELFTFLDKQPMKMFKEEAARFYAAEVVIALEYLHCLGIIYRDLKPENILLQKDGHIILTDFDLSFKTSNIQTIESSPPRKRTCRHKSLPTFVIEPMVELNSFIGTEEYIAPEIIKGAGHSSSIDWWTLGILLYEMLYGRTPFKGKNRKKTFANILFKDLTFPLSIRASLAAKQLIDALLQRDPARRLGSSNGADEIKRHPFFRQINWPKIRTMTPPQPEVALQIIQSDPKANDLKWEDGVLSHSMGADIF
ncbi:phototropin-2-like isoform X3 [Benincasa hispida]|uniref:phototropin-2-like isoform X3 n=1 Tax=Benincasa hispida TaxID=102211 RepID=UPI0019029B54|nr:phototropin-2-like isoform X3 [Benincasa hispida]